jgi:hypothetical protein
MADMRAKRTGARIDPEMIAALAAEAEEGYDLKQATPVRVGRPALGRDAAPSPRVTFRAPTDLYSALQTRAATEGRSVSELAREAVERYINS